jgi:DNA-binding LytR/AlgR family response regulator
MKMNVLIVNDEKHIDNELFSLLSLHCEKYLCQIDVVSNFEEARLSLSKFRFDLIFLEINLNLISDLDFISIIPESSKLVFVSDNPAFALFAIKQQAYDFILKPIDIRELNLSIKNCSLLFKNIRKQYLQIKSNGTTIPLQLSTIIFIRARGPYSEINLINGKGYITTQTLKSLNSQLNDSFIRVHKSYIVNREHITCYSQKKLFLDKIEIPLSRGGLVILQELFSG